MNLRIVSAVLVCGLMLFARSARADTIDFTSLAQPGTGYTSFGSSVTVDGFVFASTTSFPYGISTWNLDDPRHANDNTAASTTLLEYRAFDTTTITRQGGGTFDLNQMDLAPWGDQQSGPDFTILFTGVKADTSTVTQLVTVQNLFTGAGRPLLQTAVFTGFTDLTSVYMTQGTYLGGDAFQFTNIVVDAESVPDPASTAGLLGMALAALAAGRARRQRRSPLDGKAQAVARVIP